MEMSAPGAGTRLCGLIGDPVSHSLSPAMHNAAFHFEGLDMVYLAFRVREVGLGKVLDGVRELNFLGLNVTIPYKSKVIGLLDAIDDVAREIGAVNTIVNNDGELKGHNTDWLGALDALMMSGFEPAAGKRALIIGAGDASRAVSYALASSGMDLILTSRNWDKARLLSRQMGRMTSAEMVPPEDLGEHVRDISLVVNCTPLGMEGFPNELPLDEGLIDSGMTLFDIVYNPMETPFIKAARARGAHIVHGHEMLLGQGARSFELWTGRKAPMEVMRKAVLDRLMGGVLE
jgi:shikimate dehydrogenase